MAEKQDFGLIAYTLGVLSIVGGILLPNFGLVFGISGLILSKRQGTELSKKAKKLNIIGIVVSVLVVIISVVVSRYLNQKGITI